MELNDHDRSQSMLGTATPATGRVYYGDIRTYGYMPSPMYSHKILGAKVVRDFYDIGETKFTGIVTPIAGFIGVSLGFKMPDPTGSIEYLEGVVFMHLGFVDAFLRRIVSEAKAYNPTAHPRVFITVATSWLAEAKRAAGHDDWRDMEQVNYLAGVSNGAGVEPYAGVSDLTGAPETLWRPLRDINASDPVIRGVATAVDGAYAAYNRQYTRLVIRDYNTSLLEAHYVGTERLTLAGLDLWIVLTLDEMTVLGNVPATMAAATDAINEERNAVASEVDNKRTMSRVIVLVICVVLAALSLVVSYVVVSPITKLQKQMDRVAALELTGLDLQSTSNFSELRKMQYDFRKMVEHLIEYRAYVPSSVLQGCTDAKPTKVTAPPTGKVALVFTDIRGSTALWKKSAGDMNDAMEIHNEVIRDVCIEFEGYEVKTIGDSFMVSFSSPVAAVNFGLHVQARFQKRKWPAGLNLPESGLVIRIGVNYGPTIAEQNPVTGRVDYRGSTVNLASRVEGKAKGGTVCITSDTYAAVKSSMAKLGNPVLASFGIHEVKGLGDGHELYLVVPENLRRRLKDSESDCTEKGTLPNHFGSGFIARSGHGSGDGSESGSMPSQREQSWYKKIPNGKTALQVTRSSVTVAVCRLVCQHNHFPRQSPHQTERNQDGPTTLRQLQHHGALCG